jgi:hypothetical protein
VALVCGMWNGAIVGLLVIAAAKYDAAQYGQGGRLAILILAGLFAWEFLGWITGRRKA